MAWKLLRARTMPIGIDLGTAVLKMAQLRNVEAKLQLTAVASAAMPEGLQSDSGKRLRFLSECLRGLVKSGVFKGSKCVLSIPAAETFVQHVKTAKTSAEDLDAALRWELEGKLPFDPADAVIRHLVAGDTYSDHEAGLEVIAMGAPRRVVEAYLEMARRSRLEVVALELEPCAIMECFARLFRRHRDSQRVTLFLDVGEACTQVVIAHGAKLVFARNLMMGARQMDAAAGKAMGLPARKVNAIRRAAEESDSPSDEVERIYQAMDETMRSMAGEITKCLRYHESVFPSSRVETAVFLGGQALDRRFCQHMARQLNLPAQIGDPLTRIAPASGDGTGKDLDRRRAQPAWAVAIGLSLGADKAQAA